MAEKIHDIETKSLDEAVKKCHITETSQGCSAVIPKPIILHDNIDAKILAQWPKLKMKVPTLFLHTFNDPKEHIGNMLSLGIKFYYPYKNGSYYKILCQNFDDHRAMTQYFEKNHIPFHTFGHPSKRKMRVVIRGLPKDVDLLRLKKELKAISIPVIRAHFMHVKVSTKKESLLVLVVVPFSAEGKKLLRVKKVFGHEVQLEAPYQKTTQCHRCQKWGHSQRYCHGTIKCVKCAGEHNSKKCTRDSEDVPLKCANCGENHTASYRECPYCPDSAVYKENNKEKRISSNCSERRLLTLDDYNRFSHVKEENKVE